MDISRFHLNLIITSICLIAPLIILLSLEKWRKPKQARIVHPLPPGPKKLPIIGNLHRITSLPFRSFRDLSKQYGPIMHLTLGQVPTIVVSSPEIAKQILKDNDPNYANRPETIAFEIMWYNYTDLSFSPYGGYWRQMRKVCISELLSAKNVRSFGSIRNDEAARVVDSFRLSSGKPVSFTEKVFHMTNSITCRAVCGKAFADRDALIGLLKDGFELASGFEIADLFPKSRLVRALSWSKRRLVRMRRKIDAILDGIIDEHRGNNSSGGNGEFGNEDLIDVFLRIKESGELEFPITNDNIKAVILDMFSAGTDSSSSTLDWAMAELMRNPRVMKKAQAEVRGAFEGGSKLVTIEEHDVRKLKYLKLVIKESLRLHPPAPILPRASIDERVIDGYRVPAKTRVLVNNWAMQRDPRYWEDPESFEPERFECQRAPDFVGGDFEFLPFGSGKRMCPGMTFGLANVELPLARLLYSFDWKLPDGVEAERLDMSETLGVTALRRDELFVVATPYDVFVPPIN